VSDPSSGGASASPSPRPSLPRVVLRKNLARAIRQGHPWIYRDAVTPPSELADGQLVFVVTADRRPLVRGFWDATSPIAVRVVADASDGPDVEPVVRARIAASLARRLATLDRDATDAFRWIHGEADRLPGIHVDVYGAAAVVRYDGGGARAFYADLPARLVEAAAAQGLTLTSVIERRREPSRKDASAATDASAEKGEKGEKPEKAVAAFGVVPDGELEVRENGLRFGVDLARGQKGGLFLDQRDNRALVRTLTTDRRVLNLFGYTGGFSIYAAAGGATDTTTVDIAAPALAAARRNFERNDLPLSRARFFAEDGFAFLQRAVSAGDHYDVVISDPPSFAPSHAALEAALGAYKRLHRLCALVTKPGGILCAASCSSHVRGDAFLRTIHEGAAEAGRAFALVALRGAASDHPTLPIFPEGDYLKFAHGRLS
jgi:23S rRNA (cytosine1962-C5)-methyltransferase